MTLKTLTAKVLLCILKWALWVLKASYDVVSEDMAREARETYIFSIVVALFIPCFLALISHGLHEKHSPFWCIPGLLGIALYFGCGIFLNWQMKGLWGGGLYPED
ncbi:MAG: hypothetical protein KGJ34_02940 [Patescibacteria group bacterium]|nr:hypothetical protein [Patescibacteria group bacterium]